MNGIGAAMTGKGHYVACNYPRTQTRAGGFGKALADASGGAGKRDTYPCAGVAGTEEGSFVYAWYGAGIFEGNLREGEISSTSGIIGLSFVSGTEEPMSARMDKSSTEEDPVVLVQIGSGEKRKDFLIHINAVNPESATELEMFAFLNYVDAKNGTAMASDGAWQTYNSLRNRLVETERVDNVTGEGNCDTIRVNWIQMIQQAMEDELLRQKGWFAESFFVEDLNNLLDKLSGQGKTIM